MGFFNVVKSAIQLKTVIWRKKWSKGFIFAELTSPLREHTQFKKIRPEIVPFHIFIVSNKSINQTASFKNWSKIPSLLDVKFYSLHTLQKTVVENVKKKHIDFFLCQILIKIKVLSCKMKGKIRRKKWWRKKNEK